jgi:hypothetical protein
MTALRALRRKGSWSVFAHRAVCGISLSNTCRSRWEAL